MLLLVSLMAMTTVAKETPKQDGQKDGLVVKLSNIPESAKIKNFKVDARTLEMQEAEAIREEAAYNAATMRTFGSSSLAPRIASTMPTNPKSIADVTPLSGSYTIGTGGNFPTLSAAVGVLNFLGVNGPVTFLFTDATYTDVGVVVGAVAGASATNTITFKPAAGKTVTITLFNNAAAGGGWVFNGSKYITIDGTADGGTPGAQNLTVQYDQTQAAPASRLDGVIRIRDGATFVNVKNTKIKGILTSTGGSSGIGMSSSTAIDSLTDPDLKTFILKAVLDVTIDNCTFTNARHGVYSNGLVVYTAADFANYDRRITVKNSFFGSAYGGNIAQWAIRLDNGRNSTVSGNTIDGVTYPGTWTSDAGRVGGIRVQGYKDVVSGNVIKNVATLITGATSSARTYGIRVIGPAGLGAINNPADPFIVAVGNYISGHRISNNAISSISSLSPNGIGEMGLEFFGGVIDTADNNSVYLEAPHSGMTGTACVQGQGTPRFSAMTIFVNNVFYNTRYDASWTHWSVGIRNFDYAGAGADYDYGGNSDNNVIYGPDYIMSNLSSYGYSTMYEMATSEGTDMHSSAGNPYFVGTNDLHFDGAQPSSAAERGKVLIGGTVPAPTKDITGATRGVPPDAGAYEGSISVPTAHDLAAASIISPTNMPTGLPVVEFVAAFANLSQNTETAVPVSFKVYDPTDAVVFTGTGSIATIGWGDVAEVTFAGPFTPATQGTYTFELVVALAGDADTDNDTLYATVGSAGQVNYVYSTDFETAGSREGWSTTGDFDLASESGGDTKLTGANSGNYAYMTAPGAHGHTYNIVTVSYLVSPYFDFTGATQAVLSFQHSIATEYAWDRSIMEYTLDTGRTWMTLGTLNDPDGTNWYSQALYHYAFDDVNWDEVTAENLGFPAENPGVAPAGNWTSNEDYSPVGYVLAEYNLAALPPAKSPLGKTWVQFRYATFSDAASTDDGWAVDDFAIAAVPFNYPSAANLSGTIFEDVNGDGDMTGDSGLDGVEVYLSFGGSNVDTVTTAGGGLFAFSMDQGVGSYTVLTNIAGKAPTTSNVFAYNGDGNPMTGNIGFYQGSISGKVFEDMNDNGAFDSEPGLANWTVEIHQDSVAGALLSSITSVTGGDFTALVGPGTYGLKLVNKAGHRLSGATTAVVTISGNSGSGTSASSGNNFGAFKFGSIRVLAAVDLNGDGAFNEAAVKLTFGSFAVFKVRKNGVMIKYDSLGNGSSSDFAVNDLDVGNYLVHYLRAPAGYTRTFGVDSATFTIAASSYFDTVKNLYYKPITVSGNVYSDVNGNGTADGGDNGLSGWTVTLSGVGGGTTVTDVNGDYSFANVGQLAHTLTLTVPAGYTQTAPASAYTFTQNSNVNATGKTFGVFQNFAVNGSAYRDRDNNGAMNGIDNALADVVVTLTKDGNPLPTATSDGSGLFSFSNLGPGAYVLSAAAPAGFGQTEPAALGTYSFSGASATNMTGKVFGFFNLSDTVKYRTITVADLVAGFGTKPAKNAKADTVANIGNLVNNVVSLITVGYPGQLNPAGKTKAYLQPAKYSDVYATVNSKKTGVHTGTASGIDFTVKSGLMLKRQKSIGSDKHNNVLVANMLALNINLQASVNGNAPSGLGNLVINNGGAFNGLAIAEFVDSVNYLMTNWEKVPQSTWDAANTLAADINAAFNEPFSYDAPTFRASGTAATVVLTGGATVYSTSFLKPGTQVVPTTRFSPDVETVPTVYAMYQNYPNPFNPTTTIRFDLPMASVVTVKIYNMLGQEVSTVFDREEFSEGQQEVDFNANTLSSGVYFYRIIAEGLNGDGMADGQTFTQVLKMALIK
jgi:hypothetical protein